MSGFDDLTNNGSESWCKRFFIFAFIISTCAILVLMPVASSQENSIAHSIRIDNPKEGSDVPHEVEVNGTGDVPEGQHMWLVVNPHSASGQWWPQGGNEIMPVDGSWHINALIGGGSQDNGKKFDIALILVNDQFHQYLKGWVSETSRNQNWPSISLPSNVTIVRPIVTVSLKLDESLKLPEIIIENPKNAIEDPKNGEVLSSVEVSGKTKGDIPHGWHMWLVVNPHSAPGQWWPQGGNEIVPWNGTWYTQALIGGGESDNGKVFDIAAILVDEKDNSYLNKWVFETNENQNWPSISLPASTKRLALTRVIRSKNPIHQ